MDKLVKNASPNWGGKDRGQGRKEIVGGKRRTVTATDEEWKIMLEALQAKRNPSK